MDNENQQVDAFDVNNKKKMRTKKKNSTRVCLCVSLENRQNWQTCVLFCIINDTREMDVCMDVWGSIQYIYTSPQVHVSSLGCLSDDWKILNLSTGFPESSVWKWQPITERLTFESVTHWISYLAPRCGSKTCWTSATYTNESGGGLNRESDIDHGLVGGKRDGPIVCSSLWGGFQRSPPLRP